MASLPLMSTKAGGAAEDASKPQIRIREFRPDDVEQIITIFRDGTLGHVRESDPYHSIVVDYVNHSLGDDLADISHHYMRKEDACFFVATANFGPEYEHEVIAGCIGIQKQSENVAELRRVSVQADFRRFGIGRLLMNHVTEWAQQHKFAQLVLSTAAIQLSALKFYESLGYTPTTTEVFCADPLFELVYFEKRI